MSNEQISVTDLGEALSKARNGEEGKKRGRAAKKTDEEKAAELATREAAKVVRDAERAANKAARAAKQPAHMAKVNKAASKLPGLKPEAEAILSNVFEQLDVSQVAAFIANVQHRLRAEATASSVEMKLEAGQTVRIIGGDARFLGQIATITEARRIRVVVETEAGKSVYLLNSDVQLLASGLTESTESNVVSFKSVG